MGKIEETSVDPIEELAGVSAGTEVNGEVIVADVDADGNIVGWHKVAK